MSTRPVSACAAVFPFSASQLPQIHERRDQKQRPAKPGGLRRGPVSPHSGSARSPVWGLDHLRHQTCPPDVQIPGRCRSRRSRRSGQPTKPTPRLRACRRSRPRRCGSGAQPGCKSGFRAHLLTRGWPGGPANGHVPRCSGVCSVPRRAGTRPWHDRGLLEVDPARDAGVM
jgi:hypothetical protein